MAISSNAYSNNSTNAGYTSPIIWSPTAEAHIYEKSVFQQFGVSVSPFTLDQPGRQYNHQLENGFSMGLLTEGAQTPISALSFDQVTMTFFAYGDAKQITEEKLALSFDYIMDDLRQGAIGSMAENRDSVIVTELLTTSSTGIYSNGTASGTISSSDTFNTDMIADVEVAMLQTQASKCNAIVIHPVQKGAAMKLANFINASQYGSDAVIRSGEIGTYLGISILVSNHITTATENSITVYKAISLGNRPFLYGQKKNFVFNFERETLRDRAITASWWEMFGTTLLRDASVVILTSA